MLVTVASHSRVRKARASAGDIVAAVTAPPSCGIASARSSADAATGGLDWVDRFALTSSTPAGSTGSDRSAGPGAAAALSG